jgi:hypothetical protein
LVTVSTLTSTGLNTSLDADLFFRQPLPPALPFPTLLQLFSHILQALCSMGF